MPKSAGGFAVSPAHHLLPVHFDTARPPRPGETITDHGQVIGHVTSAFPQPGTGQCFGFALVQGTALRWAKTMRAGTVPVRKRQA
jgi:glycine cleavage system aminomethyltransferase T